MKLYQLLTCLSESKYCIIVENKSGIEVRKIEVNATKKEGFTQAMHEVHKVVSYTVTDIWHSQVLGGMQIHVQSMGTIYGTTQNTNKGE